MAALRTLEEEQRRQQLTPVSQGLPSTTTTQGGIFPDEETRNAAVANARQLAQERTAEAVQNLAGTPLAAQRVESEELIPAAQLSPGQTNVPLSAQSEIQRNIELSAQRAQESQAPLITTDEVAQQVAQAQRDREEFYRSTGLLRPDNMTQEQYDRQVLAESEATRARMDAFAATRGTRFALREEGALDAVGNVAAALADPTREVTPQDLARFENLTAREKGDQLVGGARGRVDELRTNVTHARASASRVAESTLQGIRAQEGFMDLTPEQYDQQVKASLEGLTGLEALETRMYLSENEPPEIRQKRQAELEIEVARRRAEGVAATQKEAREQIRIEQAETGFDLNQQSWLQSLTPDQAARVTAEDGSVLALEEIKQQDRELYDDYITKEGEGDLLYIGGQPVSLVQAKSRTRKAKAPTVAGAPALTRATESLAGVDVGEFDFGEIVAEDPEAQPDLDSTLVSQIANALEEGEITQESISSEISSAFEAGEIAASREDFIAAYGPAVATELQSRAETQTTERQQAIDEVGMESVDARLGSNEDLSSAAGAVVGTLGPLGMDERRARAPEAVDAYLDGQFGSLGMSEGALSDVREQLMTRVLDDLGVSEESRRQELEAGVVATARQATTYRDVYGMNPDQVSMALSTEQAYGVPADSMQAGQDAFALNQLPGEFSDDAQRIIANATMPSGVVNGEALRKGMADAGIRNPVPINTAGLDQKSSELIVQEGLKSTDPVVRAALSGDNETVRDTIIQYQVPDEAGGYNTETSFDAKYKYDGALAFWTSPISFVDSQGNEVTQGEGGRPVLPGVEDMENFKVERFVQGAKGLERRTIKGAGEYAAAMRNYANTAIGASLLAEDTVESRTTFFANAMSLHTAGLSQSNRTSQGLATSALGNWSQAASLPADLTLAQRLEASIGVLRDAQGPEGQAMRVQAADAIATAHRAWNSQANKVAGSMRNLEIPNTEYNHISSLFRQAADLAGVSVGFAQQVAGVDLGALDSAIERETGKPMDLHVDLALSNIIETGGLDPRVRANRRDIALHNEAIDRVRPTVARDLDLPEDTDWFTISELLDMPVTEILGDWRQELASELEPLLREQVTEDFGLDALLEGGQEVDQGLRESALEALRRRRGNVEAE